MELIVDNFDLKSVITSGACFRVTINDDGSYTNILKDRVINVKQVGNKLIVESSINDNLEEIIKEYFDLNRDYNTINKQLINNKKLKELVENNNNYKILNQDSFEMCISYIISQNNNVKRISSIIEKIAENYGEKVFFDNKEYFLFPTYEKLKNITIDELKNYGLGFRDKYIRNFLDFYPNMKNIDNLTTNEALDELMSVKGIGLKVASCILLFGYKRLDVFPIDTWVKKYIVEHYNIKDDIKEIKKFAEEYFKEYSGLIIQYMFNSQRNI